MIIGRRKELSSLNRVYHSNEAEFIVVYGRRRVGKTFLVREYFHEQSCMLLHVTGLQKGGMAKQLAHFSDVLAKCFMSGIELKLPKSWDDAFKILTQFIENEKSTQKIVIFLDELPWMATRKSGLLEALDYYWNRFWSSNPRVILIACGSSASWLIKNIIYNKGGLHNRCTCELRIEPFCLAEVEEFLISKGVQLNRRHVLELYLALGGIPYYLRYVESHLTAAENIQKILFEKNAPLAGEFEKLFKSLFSGAAQYIELITIIASKREGIARSEIERLSNKISIGGRLSMRLNNLIQANFIESFMPWGKKRGEYFRLMDEFCLFYIYWILPNRYVKFTSDHWLKQHNKPSYHAWAGLAFEAICLKHIESIINALQIKTAEYTSSWRIAATGSHEFGAQIDLLIDRSDDAITVCEIKYTDEPFIIDKLFMSTLNTKVDIFKKKTQTKKQVFIALISANGIKQNQYSNEGITGVVTLNDLFVTIRKT